MRVFEADNIEPLAKVRQQGSIELRATQNSQIRLAGVPQRSFHLAAACSSQFTPIPWYILPGN
jgi:hypothetical protein